MRSERHVEDGLGLGFALNALVFVVILHQMIRFIALVFMTSFRGYEMHAALAIPRPNFSVFDSLVFIVLLAIVWTIGQVAVTIKSGAPRMISAAAWLAVVACLATMVYVCSFRVAAREASASQAHGLAALAPPRAGFVNWRAELCDAGCEGGSGQAPGLRLAT